MHTRWSKALALAGAVVVAAACSDDTPTNPNPGPQPPAAPANLAATQVSLTEIQVSWSAVTGATGYRLERADPSNPGVFAQIGGGDLPGGSTSFNDTGVTQGVNYSYRVATVAGTEVSTFAGPVNFATGVLSATVSGNITSDRTFTKDTVYTLSGFVKVTNGATLTIDPGTKIVGDISTPGSSLWITRGAKIMAVGTAAEPIVFTSSAAVGTRAPGDWGGIIMIGNGIINRTGSPILTEGPAAVSEDYSGGSNNADNSGTLKYVRVEFAGFDVSNGSGQELNSISMYAVGSGTQLEYVESLAGLDDSFEWWGGAVQGRFLLSYESGDDHFDWSEGFRGQLQHIVAFQTQRLNPRPGTGTFSSDPRGIEADGCDPGASGCSLTNQPHSLPTIANFTIIGAGNNAAFPKTDAIVLRRGTGAYLVNGISARFLGAGLECRDVETGNLLAADSLNVKNVIFSEVGDGNYDGGVCDAPDFTGDNHTNAAAVGDIVTSVNTAGLDWTGVGAALTSGGMIDAPYGSNFFGGSMASTSYVGAGAPSGDPNYQWWAGWSTYALN